MDGARLLSQRGLRLGGDGGTLRAATRQRLERRCVQPPQPSRRRLQVDAIAIPGPLFMSPYDRDRFRNVGKPQLYPSSFIQFPAR